MVHRCTLCRYWLENGEAKTCRAALEETICEDCHVGFCRSCLDSLFTPTEWQAMLDLGGAGPTIGAKCSQCKHTFCKYGILGDPRQALETHSEGPHGRTRLEQCCILSVTEYEDRFIEKYCTLGLCAGNDVLFCSMECMRQHCAYCSGCGSFEHTALPDREICRPCFEAERLEPVDDLYCSLVEEVERRNWRRLSNGNWVVELDWNQSDEDQYKAKLLRAENAAIVVEQHSMVGHRSNVRWYLLDRKRVWENTATLQTLTTVFPSEERFRLALRGELFG